MFLDRIEGRPDQDMDEALGVGLGFGDETPIQDYAIRDISFPN